MTREEVAEVTRCSRNFRHFADTYAHIVDKDGALVRFRPFPAQDEIWKLLQASPWTFVLKARQIRCTAAFALYFFWKAMFTPNFRVLVVAHRRQSAEDVFDKLFKPFYDYLPVWMRRMFKLKRSNVRELRFFHGGFIRVTTADSPEARSGTYQAVLLTEAAHYEHFKEAVSAILSTAGPGAQIAFETTANGPNDAFLFWTGSGEFKGSSAFKRQFFPWMVEPGYTGRHLGGDRYAVDLGVGDDGEPQRHEVDFEKEPLTDWEREYQKDHQIPTERMAWVRWALAVKCVGDRNLFLQEFPPTANLAFILGGRPFFSVHYPEVLGEEDEPGVSIFMPPQKFRAYVLGADFGSGAPGGSWSAFTIYDATEEMKWHEVATAGFIMEPIAFSELAYELAVRYDAFTCIEANNTGVTGIEFFLKKGFPRMYVRQVVTKVTRRIVQKAGFATQESTRRMALSAFNDKLRKGELVLRCPRSKRAVNHFVFSDKGRPQAAQGKTDDFVFCNSMAVQAALSIGRMREEVLMKRRPASVAEVVQWEFATGRLYTAGNEVFADDLDDPVRQILVGPARSVTDALSASLAGHSAR